MTGLRHAPRCAVALGWLVFACSSDPAPDDTGSSGATGGTSGSGTAGVPMSAAGSKTAGAGSLAMSGAGGAGAAGGASAQGGAFAQGGASGASSHAGATGGGAPAQGGTAGVTGTAGTGVGGMAGALTNGGAGMGGVAFGGRGGMSAGASGSGGMAQSGAAGASGGVAGAAGASSNSGPFTCSQLTGGQLVEEWFIAGFESVVDNARWQVKWRVDGYLEEWADPSSSFWSATVDSKCTNGTTSPDRIVFPIVSWQSRSRQDWVKAIEQAIATIKTKYTGIRRFDLMTQIRGPMNKLCPTAPTAGETIVVPPELDAAIDDVAAENPGFVFVAPVVEARSCSDIQGGGPHLTTAGNTAAAVPLADYFVKAQ